MTKGFVSVHRKMMDNPIWSDPHYIKLWMYCLFQASHKQHEQLVGNKMITLERGQFVTGRYSLAEDLNRGMKPKQKLNEKTWFRYLNNLEKWGMLTIKSTNKYSVVTVDKYDFYQTPGNQYDQETDHQMSNKSPSNVQQMSTNNNGNNGNNENKIPYADIVDRLNEKANKNFKHTSRKTKELIQARWNEGNTLDDFYKVIDYCSNEWAGKKFSNGKDGDNYLQPSTLFNGRFDERLNWALSKSESVSSEPQKTPEQIEYEKMARGEI